MNNESFDLDDIDNLDIIETNDIIKINVDHKYNKGNKQDDTWNYNIDNDKFKISSVADMITMNKKQSSKLYNGNVDVNEMNNLLLSTQCKKIDKNTQ